MTKFEHDVLNAIADGHAYYDDIVAHLKTKGRRHVTWTSLSRAMGRLRAAGKIETSMAGRNTVSNDERWAG